MKITNFVKPTLLLLMSLMSLCSYCQNQISTMSIAGSDLKAIVDDASIKRIFLQFKTDDGKTFYADAYTYNGTNFTPIKSLKPFAQVDDLVDLPYSFGDLSWSTTGKTVDATATYLLIPFTDADKHVNYKFLSIAKDSLPVEDIQDIDPSKLTQAQIEKIKSLLKYILRTTSLGSFNPVPPKSL